MAFGGRLWQALLKARDPFGEIARENDGRRLLGRRRHARERLEALQAAAARGEDVTADIVTMEAEIEDLTAQLPRGHIRDFVCSAALCVVIAVMLVGQGADFRDAIAKTRRTLDDPYLLEHGYAATRICQVGQWITSSLVSGVVLAALWVLLWHVQRRLQRRHARILLGAADLAVFATCIVLMLARTQVLRLAVHLLPPA